MQYCLRIHPRLSLVEARLKRCCYVSAPLCYSSSKHLYWRIYRKSWRKSILSNKEPLKRGRGSELRVDTNMHDNKWRKRQNGSSEEGNSRNIEQIIPGYTALLESIWGFCSCHPTGLCKEVWHYWGAELDWNLPVKFPSHSYSWKDIKGRSPLIF